jgi:RNA polymerase sigma-70 factor (ECF subfamily)
MSSLTWTSDQVHQSDAALSAAARGGSLRAFELLVERYHAALLRYFTVQTGDRELAADLVQETFLDAYRSRAQLPTDYSFAAWLYRVGRNNLLHEWRKQRLRRAVSLDALAARLPGQLMHRAPPAGIDDIGERDLIRSVLDGLSQGMREALILSSQCGFTSREVAMILGISPDAAKRRIGRAKLAFSARYRELERNSVDARV